MNLACVDFEVIIHRDLLYKGRFPNIDYRIVIAGGIESDNLQSYDLR